MTTQIRRSDYPDYMSYLDAICAPIGGADSHIVWDEDEEEWVIDPEWVFDRERQAVRRRDRTGSAPPTRTG
jgi:hypothetical protein